MKLSTASRNFKAVSFIKTTLLSIVFILASHQLEARTEARSKNYAIQKRVSVRGASRVSTLARPIQVREPTLVRIDDPLNPIVIQPVDDSGMVPALNAYIVSFVPCYPTSSDGLIGIALCRSIEADVFQILYSQFNIIVNLHSDLGNGFYKVLISNENLSKLMQLKIINSIEGN